MSLLPTNDELVTSPSVIPIPLATTPTVAIPAITPTPVIPNDSHPLLHGTTLFPSGIWWLVVPILIVILVLGISLLMVSHERHG
jgi:hypothetical protein